MFNTLAEDTPALIMLKYDWTNIKTINTCRIQRNLIVCMLLL